MFGVVALSVDVGRVVSKDGAALEPDAAAAPVSRGNGAQHGHIWSLSLLACQCYTFFSDNESR